MDIGAIVVLGTFLFAHTGVLIYFAGRVNEILRYHGEILKEHRAMFADVNERCNESEKTICALESKMEMLTR